MTEQGGLEGGPVGKAGEAGEGVELGRIGRQALGLLVAHHLEPVLDGAQEGVGCSEFVARLLRDPAIVVEARQHRDGGAPAQDRAPSAEDELLGLHEELDLADAAAAELDVVTGDGERLVAAHGVDLALHRVHVGDRREVEILAPDEGRQFGQEPFARRDVAGDRPGLDEGRPLPVLPGRLVIDIGRGEAERRRRRAGIGAEPVIDPVDIAVAGPLLQELGRALREAGEERRRLQTLLERRDLGIEEDDQVDIAGVIELPPAELAEAEHHETGAGLRVLTVGRVEPSGGGGLEQERVEGRRDRGIGEVRERGGDPFQRPRPADIRERHQKRVLGPVPPQDLADRFEIGRCAVLSASCNPLLPEDACIGFLGRRPKQSGEAVGVAGGERPQERRVLGQGQQETARRPVAEFGRQGLGHLGEARLGRHRIGERRHRPEALDPRSAAAIALGNLPVFWPAHIGPPRPCPPPPRGPAHQARNASAFKGQRRRHPAASG